MKEALSPPGTTHLNMYLFKFSGSEQFDLDLNDDAVWQCEITEIGVIKARRALKKIILPKLESPQMISGIDIAFSPGVFAAYGGSLFAKNVFLTPSEVTVIARDFADPYSTRLRIVYPRKPR